MTPFTHRGPGSTRQMSAHSPRMANDWPGDRDDDDTLGAELEHCGPGAGPRGPDRVPDVGGRDDAPVATLSRASPTVLPARSGLSAAAGTAHAIDARCGGPRG